jgi:hypothetical protein
MPLRRSAVGRASRKNEVSSLLRVEWRGRGRCSLLDTFDRRSTPTPLCHRVRSLKAISVMTGRRDT